MTRRSAAGLALGGPCAFGLALGDARTKVRLALSETILSEVNLNDARAAMKVWIRVMGRDLDVAVDEKLFSTTAEIHARARRGELDTIALNVIEYRPIADLLESSQMVSAAGTAGNEQYQLVVKRDGGPSRLEDLKGRRLNVLRSPRMCLAADWLANTLDGARLGLPDRFFAAMVENTKFSQVVLPVFFGQADACLTTKQGLDTMAELNPQVGRALRVLAHSPALTLNIYVFRKGYPAADRQRVVQAIAGMRGSVSGRQLATLFQFDDLAVQNAGCLGPALHILKRADQLRGRPGRG